MTLKEFVLDVYRSEGYWATFLTLISLSLLTILFIAYYERKP